MPQPVRDRFDDVPRSTGRVGAHRAENPGLHGLPLFLWAAIATLILIIVGVLIALSMMGRITIFPAAEPAPASTAAPKAAADPSYSVVVLNATSVQGVDAGLRNMIIAGGWAESDVIYGAASSEDFPKTVVYYVAPGDLAAAQGLANVIGATTVEQSDFYADPQNPDLKQLVVVIGADLADSIPIPTATPTPTPTPTDAPVE